MDIILPTRFNNPNLPIVQRPGFADDFNRPAADTLGVTSGESRPWQTFDIGSNPSVWGTHGDGTAGMKTAGSSWQLAGVDGLVSDGALTAALASIGGDTSRWGGLAFRIIDGDNHYRIVEASASDPRIILQKRVGGTTSALGTATVSPSPGDEISVTFSGSQIAVYLNGSTVITATSTDLPGETVHGFYSQSATVATWNSIEFTPA